MPLKQHPTDPDKLVFVKGEYDLRKPWVGLTDEEIKSLPSWWPSYEDAPALVQLVKDVEVKLKEKNTCA